MKLSAKAVPYSNIVGGGITLCDEAGAARFMIMFRGTTDGISKQQTEALTTQIGAMIEKCGLDVAESGHGG